MVISDIHPYWPVSGHDYTEFFDETGQEYRIPEYPHDIGQKQVAGIPVLPADLNSPPFNLQPAWLYSPAPLTFRPPSPDGPPGSRSPGRPPRF